MIDGLAFDLLPARSRTDSGFTGTTVPWELLETTERDHQRAISIIRAAHAVVSPPRIYLASTNIGMACSNSAQIFDAIQALYLSSNRPRDRQIAERVTTIHRDALAEGELIRAESLTQFASFFVQNPDLHFPKITLTPDGTLRARWIRGPGDFVAIEFTGQPLVRLVAEMPRDNETARYFISEPVRTIVETARVIGASFG